MNIHQYRSNIKRFNEGFSKHKDVRKQWNKHTKKNMSRFNHENSIWRLDLKYNGIDEKAMVLVGASPCLREDVIKLKELDDNFCIICANSALKFLLKNGIRPTYCLCLDSDIVDIPQHLDCDSEGITLLASSVVAPQVLDNWKGPIYYMAYYSVDKELRVQLRRRLGRAIMGGGNSISQALYVATVIFGSHTVMFVGNELCFDDPKNYYADKKAFKHDPLKTLYPVVDVKGRNRWTLPGHWNYAIWIENICGQLTPPGYFIDTSFGLLGTDTATSIHIMELSEAIDKVKDAFLKRDRLNAAKSDKAKAKILLEIMPKHEPSEVYRYNVSEHRERLLQLSRS